MASDRAGTWKRESPLLPKEYLQHTGRYTRAHTHTHTHTHTYTILHAHIWYLMHTRDRTTNAFTFS